MDFARLHQWRSSALDVAKSAASAAAASAKEAASVAKEAASVAKERTASLIADVQQHRSTELVTIQGTQMLLLKVIAEGGYGYVHLARKPDDNRRHYAVKRMLAQTREAADMAKAEIAMLKALKHPNIVQYHASEARAMDGGRGTEYLLVMEFVSGGTLARHVTPTDSGVMPPQVDEERLLRNVLDVAKAVAHLHMQTPPITHRDLKLENVLETPRGVCKLCDFGSATIRTFDPSTASRREKLDEEDVIQRYSCARPPPCAATSRRHEPARAPSPTPPRPPSPPLRARLTAARSPPRTARR